jgi:hypothetical protein
MDRYIGLDVHASSCTLGVVTNGPSDRHAGRKHTVESCTTRRDKPGGILVVTRGAGVMAWRTARMLPGAGGYSAGWRQVADWLVPSEV